MKNGMDYEAVIGLEAHLQLSTNSKIFCGSSTKFGAEPNMFIDPVTLGLPGCLPVLNRQVVEYAIMLGLALSCEIRPFSRFARKHYFYPDLPKGYQISQYEEPICERGHLDITVEGATRTIGIKRIHMEEDAGKSIHDPPSLSSLVDLNRAGVPLLEIVSEPDLRTPAEAAAYLKTLRQIARYLGISAAFMEEGSLRCDANVSLRPVGELKFGVRCEIKNLNSFKFVEKALEFEIARQRALLKTGRPVMQETMLFDSANGTTRPIRAKEESDDYRYFPDPDLPPLVIEESWVEEIRRRLPKLPEQVKQELCEIYGLSVYDAGVLTAEKACVDYFYRVFDSCSNAKAACNWITSELFGALNRAGLSIEKSPVPAQHLGELIRLVDSEVISGKMAKSVFEEMFATSHSPQEIITMKGLTQITDEGTILRFVQQAFDENPAQLAEYVAGNDGLHGYMVGKVMKVAKGNANPKKVNELIKREIARLRQA